MIVFVASVALSLVTQSDGDEASAADLVLPLDHPFVAPRLEGRTQISDEQANGRVVSKISLVRLPVFDPEDVAISWANSLRLRSRDWLIRGQFDFQPGEQYQRRRMDDMINRLKRLGIFSEVRAVLLAGPDQAVEILVITRDAWSLYPGFRSEGGGGELSVGASLIENNLLGTGSRLSLDSSVRGYAVDATPSGRMTRVNLGQGVFIRSIAGSSWFVEQSSLVNLGTREGGYEGLTLGLAVGRARRSRAEPWEFTGSFAVSDRLIIRTTGDGLLFDDFNPLAPEAWQLFMSGSLRWRYQWGDPVQASISFGPSLFWRKQRLGARIYEGYESLLPERRLPSVDATFTVQRFDFWRNRGQYTYAFEKYIPLGWVFSLSASWSDSIIGSTERFVGLNGLATAQALVANAVFIRATAFWSALFDYQLHQVREHELVAFLRLHSRPLGSETVWVRFGAQVGYHMLLNGEDNLGIGGQLDTRITPQEPWVLGVRTGQILRGYAAANLRGEQLIHGNVEIISAPVNLKVIYIGLVGFFDWATIMPAFNPLDPNLPCTLCESVGVGVRVEVPPFTRSVFRIDYAFPLRATTLTEWWQRISFGYFHTF